MLEFNKTFLNYTVYIFSINFCSDLGPQMKSKIETESPSVAST